MFLLDDAQCFLILPSVFILTIVSCSSQDDIETEELSFGGVEVVQLETEDVSGDEDSRFLELFPTPSPHKEADIEYILKQVEIRKLQARAYQALEKFSDCLYSYRDVALQVFDGRYMLRIVTQRQLAGLRYGYWYASREYHLQCPFSVEMAPDFNALGRAFPGVDIMAVDVSQSSGLYTRYGIVAVPDILLLPT
ncbi:putative thioredoxin domain-containing protein 15 isoform X2 [Apostichopus japonicus]|uniref:Putative thioredoxin domain-containing protein 15 isoform X2 n=1 Tax=Stichopus japonicus TaxID=307972 RepID=A0A2G8K1G4_STIJA|nr:putative thioredoxin domain-containing protein 15 isoform X2 [Apostichopus japonicus]